MKELKYFAIGAVLAFIVAKYADCSNKSQAEQILLAYDALKDELKQVRNDLGQQQSTISNISATSLDVIKKIESQDSLFLILQNGVKKGSKGGIVHTIEHHYNDTGSVKIIRDTFNQIQYPLIATKKDDYFNGKVQLFEKNSIWDIKTKDTLVYELTTKRTGFLGMGSKKHTITATNYNPYSNTTGLRSFTINEKNKRHSIGINITYGMTDRFDFGFHVGLGYNYSLFNW